jgi:hypothetical protein
MIVSYPGQQKGRCRVAAARDAPTPRPVDLAGRKGFDVTMSTMNRLPPVGPLGNLVKNNNGGAGFSYAEARQYRETPLDGRSVAWSPVIAGRSISPGLASCAIGRFQ